MPDLSRHATMADEILDHASRDPQRIAVIHGEASIGFGELADRLATIGAALEASGIEAAMRVGVVTACPVEAMVAQLALLARGAVPCPMDPSGDAPTREAMADAYGLSAFLESEACFGAGPHSIRMDAAWLAGRAPEAPRPFRPAAGMRGETMLLTSGTTGLPSASIRSVERLNAGIADFVAVGRISRDTVFLSQAPHFTTVGAWMPVAVLQHGGRVVIAPHLRSLEDLADAANHHGVTFMSLVPRLVQGLVAIARQRGQIPLLPGAEALLVGADFCSAELLSVAAEYLTPGVMLTYGTTTSGLVTILEATDFGRKAGSVGRPLPGVRVEVVDGGDRPVPPGIAGRLRIRNAMVPEAILGPQKSNGEGVKDGWLYPGDIGRLDGEGYLHVLGRESDVFQNGGITIYPVEIERCLTACPGVREIAVAGLPDPSGGARPIVFAVVDPGTEPATLLAHAAAHLPPVQRPVDVVLLDGLPRNATGKVRKRDLVAEYRACQPVTADR